MKLAVFKQNDRRVAINTDAIISIQEVTEVDGNYYVALIFKGSTLYFTNYSYDYVIKCLVKDEKLHKNYKPHPDADPKLFFTFICEGKKLGFKLDDIIYIQETDIEGEYYITLHLQNGTEYYVEGKFNEVINDLAWTVYIDPDKE